MPLHVCPRCDQASPQCLVHMENVGGGQIALEPVSEVCDANSSCPIVDPASCQFAALNCTFTAPSTPGPYTVVVATPSGSISRNLTVVAAGPASCAFP